MEAFARGMVVGFAVPAMYYFNKAALGTLFAFNMEIGKVLGRLILPPPPPPSPLQSPVFSFERTCNKIKCPIDSICPCDGYHCICYDCDGEKLGTKTPKYKSIREMRKRNPKYTSPCLTTNS